MRIDKLTTKFQEALGEAQIAAGDGQRAISTFKKLSSAQPKNPMYAVRLADAFRANKDYDAAIGALKLALHRACIARLFEQNDLLLDAEEIYGIAKGMVGK